MVINGIIDLDNGELLEATGKHRISALDIQGSETAELKLTFSEANTTVDIANNDELLNANPIRIKLGFER